MTERSIHHENARRLCAELRMFGSPTLGEHLGAKQSGTILWERDGWPFVEAKIAKALEEAEAKAARFRDLLMSRPATNAALPQSYVEWNSRMYLVDGEGFVREPEELLTALTKLDQQEGRN